MALYLHTNRNTRLQQYQKTGTYKPEPLNCGRKPKIQSQTMQAIVEEIKQQPDITLNELIEEFDLKPELGKITHRSIV